MSSGFDSAKGILCASEDIPDAIYDGVEASKSEKKRNGDGTEFAPLRASPQRSFIKIDWQMVLDT